MSARERILARIRERQGRSGELGEAEIAAVRAHLAAHARNAMPHDTRDAVTRFRERALSLASTVAEAATFADVPRLIATYLDERGLPRRAVCWSELVELDWRSSGLSVEARSARSDDLVGITGVYCAIGETGTLMTLSGVATPPTVSLLPETHVALVPCARIVPSMEDAWALLRREHGTLPRAVNFISGPSRTADIEQTVTLGAHGPYRVHVVLIQS